MSLAILVVLVLGIDRFGPAQGSGHYTNSGAADVPDSVARPAEDIQLPV